MQSKFSASAKPDLRAANDGRSSFNPLANLGGEEELPPPETKRWVIRRKAIVVAAVRSGLLSLEEACSRYKLSIEEFLSWQRLIDSHGLAGLRVTRLQDYRGSAKSR
jgi:Protein of unknown function (DUF1153)